MKTIYIGIDNGVTGAIAIVPNYEGAPRWEKVPVEEIGTKETVDPAATWKLLKSVCETAKADQARVVVVFEQGQKQPKFGCKGNFSNGMNFGLVWSLLAAASIEFGLTYHNVNPKTWQAVILKDLRGATLDTKAAAIAYCARTYPLIPLIIGRCRNPHDGAADALCMADYGRRQNL